MPMDDHERLAVLAEAARTGQAAAVELELNDWRRRPDCPTAARVMLAGLLAQRGELETALTILAEADERDLDVLQARIAVLMELERWDEARACVDQLHHEHGFDPRVELWLRAMEAPGVGSLPIVTDAEVEALAGELIGAIHVMPTLVAAQKVRADLHSVRLLREAIGYMARDVHEPRQMLLLCEAMAELSLLLGDEDEARRWTHRGLRIEPYYAPLAIVLAKIEDDPTVGPAALEVLDRTAQRHPGYRDVLAALIRRQFARGDRNAARERLRRWQEQEPHHPVVQSLANELAA